MGLHDGARGEGGGVAVFIDWDNLAIGAEKDLPGVPLDLTPILEYARQFGTMLVCRAYSEWIDPEERLRVYEEGVEVVYAPVVPQDGKQDRKSLADTAMAVDCVDLLHLMPEISTFVLVTSDKDLLPVLRLASVRGKRVVVIGSDYTAKELREAADEFVSYRELLGRWDVIGEPREGQRPYIPPGILAAPGTSERRSPRTGGTERRSRRPSGSFRDGRFRRSF
jgi:uncharacterized protein (TIGR00288 family)